jgi:uncharacterized membrane protein YkoI
MKKFAITAFAATLGLATLGFTSVARADDDIPLDEVLRLVQSGTIKPLEELNEIAIGLHPGTSVKDSELERKFGRYVYQVELRGSMFGQEWDVDLDAVTGEVLRDRQDD